jgi:amino acid transporter
MNYIIIIVVIVCVVFGIALVAVIVVMSVPKLRNKIFPNEKRAKKRKTDRKLKMITNNKTENN